MATFSKTASLTLLALQSVAASSQALSAQVDVSGKMGGLVYVRFGRRSATAAGAGVNIRIEASFAASGNDSWFPLAEFTTNFAACEAEAVTGTVAAGATAVTCASTTNLTAQDQVFIDNTAGAGIATSEWVRLKSIVANTSVTPEFALTNAATGGTMYDSAEIYTPVKFDEGTIRLQAVVDGSLFTQAFAIEVRYSTIDSIG